MIQNQIVTEAAFEAAWADIALLDKMVKEEDQDAPELQTDIPHPTSIAD